MKLKPATFFGLDNRYFNRQFEKDKIKSIKRIRSSKFSSKEDSTRDIDTELQDP